MVHWEDIVGLDRPWLSPEEAMELAPAPMCTVGILVHQTDAFVTLASTVETVDDEPQLGSVVCIPTGVVKALWDIPVPKGA